MNCIKTSFLLAGLIMVVHSANQTNTGQPIQCQAINFWAGMPDMDEWCTEACVRDNCPEYACNCDQQTTPPTTGTRTPATGTLKPATNCHATNYWTGDPYLDKWCADNCAKGNCPDTSCKCTNEAPTGNTLPTKLDSKTTASKQSSKSTPAPPTIQNTPTMPPVTQATPTPSVAKQPAKTTTIVMQKVCKAINIWKGIDVFDRWCTENCNKNGADSCPSDTCQCVNSLVPLTNTDTTQMPFTFSTRAPATRLPTTTTVQSTTQARRTTQAPATTHAQTTTHAQSATHARCTSNGVVAGDYWDRWCQTQCDNNSCPLDYCNC